MFPAAVGIVVASFPLHERGRAMAIFFGISGGLTAIGPIAGGYLTQWTWRSIFWINVPVAIVALLLIWRAQPDNERHPTQARLPRHGADHGRDGADRARAPAVEHVGLEQRRDVGLHRRRPGRCMVAFVVWELRTPDAAAAAADLPRPRLRGRDDRARPDLGRLRAVLLLRQRLRAGGARRDASHAGIYIAVLLPGLRDHGPGRRPDPRQARRPARGGLRLRARRGRLLPARRQAHRPVAQRPVAVRDARRRRASA